MEEQVQASEVEITPLDTAIDVAELLNQQLKQVETPEPEDKPNPAVEAAREKGWRPKDEFNGDPAEWVDADEFVRRQPFIDRIKTQSRKLKELEKTVEALVKHQSVTIKQAKAQAIKELQAQRTEAIELGEVKRVHAIEEQMSHVAQMPEPPAPSAPIVEEYDKFMADNKDWYNKDPEMTDFAIAFQENYLKRHGVDKIQESLDKTLEAVKKAYPDKFENKRKYAPAAVESGSRPAVGAKYTVNRLTPEQKLAYNQFVRVHKMMSHDEYFKQLEEIGALEN